MYPAAIVEFSGGRHGTRPSTWGQYSIWAEMQVAAPDHERFNIPIEASREEGLPLDGLIAAIRRALAAHESLRTRLRHTEEGELQQVLYGAIRLPIYVMTASDKRMLRGGKEALRTRLLGQPFDFEAEWPIRVGAIARDGLIRYVLIAVSHHAMDRDAVPFLERTLWREEIGPTVPIGLQPFDEAQYQESAKGQRIAAAAADYWRVTLLQAPSRMFRPESADPRTPRYWSATLTSWALPLAARSLATDMQVGQSAVLLAAVSATISAVTGTDRCALLLQVHNRFRPQLRQAVSSVTMEGLFLVETGGAVFREIIRRSWPAALAAYKNAYHDRRRIDAVIREVERVRGTNIDLSCWVNDMRSLENSPPAERTVMDITRKLALTEVQWPATYERHNNVTFGLRAYGSHEVVRLELIADTHALPPAQMEYVLRQIEALVVGAVTGR